VPVAIGHFDLKKAIVSPMNSIFRKLPDNLLSGSALYSFSQNKEESMPINNFSAMVKTFSNEQLIMNCLILLMGTITA
jgi:hypothetical protein